MKLASTGTVVENIPSILIITSEGVRLIEKQSLELVHNTIIRLAFFLHLAVLLMHVQCDLVLHGGADEKGRDFRLH
jgi:hypothetical protein